jgi:hypothetical protein
MMTMISFRRAVRKYAADELDSFENTMHVSLPRSYREYLINVGVGDQTPARLSLLEDWRQPYSSEEMPDEYLSQPFQFTEAWNDRTLVNEVMRWDSPYFDPALLRGSMRIVNLGDESYYLLVVTGSEREHVWCDDRAGNATGISPLQQTNGARVRIEDYLLNPDGGFRRRLP